MEQQQENPLTALSTTLRNYDVAHLLGTIGALHLLPRNADQAIRLEALAHAALCLEPQENRPRISAGRLRVVCASDDLSSFAWAEDPCDETFVEEMSFYGGSYRLMPGITESGTFILQHIAKAIFLAPSVFVPRHFVHEARILIHSALLISEEIARRADLVIGTLPISAHREPIAVPDALTMERLRAAVTFSRADLEGLLAKASLDLSAVDAYLLNAGTIRPDQFHPGNAPCQKLPLIRVSDTYVVPCPSAFVGAARHAVIIRAHDLGVTDELSNRFAAAVWDTVEKSLSYVRHQKSSLQLPSPFEYPGTKSALFEFDNDKVLYAILATDPLENYDSDKVFGTWDDPKLCTAIQQRILEVEELIYSSASNINDLLFLVVMQGVGRAGFLGFTELPRFSRLIGWSAADLETIALAETGEPLAFWKYAGAAQDIRDSARVVVTSNIDEYQMYRSHRHSFYLSDDVKPDVILIPAGTGGPLRREVADKRAWHTVPSFRRGFFQRVTAVHDTRSIPIYTPFPLQERLSFLVEGLPPSIWITGPAHIPHEYQSLSKLYAIVLDGIAYWIWQFTPFLEPRLAALSGKVLRLDVELTPDHGWHADQTYSDENIREAISTSADRDGLTLSITITSAFTRLASGSDNSGERRLVREILRSFRHLLPDEGNLFSDEVIDVAIDEFAPLGLKKMLLFIRTDTTPQLDPRGIPKYRRIQEADINTTLDSLGQHLRSHRPVGPIPQAETNDVIKESASYFLVELQRVLASLSPIGLLEYLVRHHEAVSRQTAFAALTTPTRVACYESDPTIRKHLEEEIPALSGAALAGRFLIELAASQPPTGLRPISLSTFDEMQALASHVINDGMLSDLVHFNLASMQLSILPSGRLGIDADQHRHAMQRYMEAFAAEEISRSPGGFSRFWRTPARGNSKSDLVDRIDAASIAEFGFSMTEMLQFLTAVMNIGYDVDPAVSVLNAEELRGRLCSDRSAKATDVNALMERFSLGPRSGFYEVPPPYRREDVYPWRFNRELSYLRKPLIIRDGQQGTEVLWGNRHIEDAKKYLIQLCTSGRLRATSSQMKSFLGEMHDDSGNIFNDKVAAFLFSVPGLKVRPKFKKLKTRSGTVRPPGDIDVLAIDTKRARIHPIECKGLSAARTPFELATEVEQLLDGKRTHASMVHKHELRVLWCREHLKDILAEFQVDTSSRWRMEPYIVVDQPLATSHLRRSPIPILTLRELQEKFIQR